MAIHKKLESKGLPTSVDFSDMDDEINKVSMKYFKYWIMESLKGKDIDDSNISYDDKRITIAFEIIDEKIIKKLYKKYGEVDINISYLPLY